jgi:hypothetical protein
MAEVRRVEEERRSELTCMRPALARQSGLDMNLRFPGPRQQLVETVDGMSIDHPREHVGEVSIGFDAVECIRQRNTMLVAMSWWRQTAATLTPGC